VFLASSEKRAGREINSRRNAESIQRKMNWGNEKEAR